MPAFPRFRNLWGLMRFESADPTTMETTNPIKCELSLPAFRGQVDYTVSWRVCQHNSNRIGLR